MSNSTTPAVDPPAESSASSADHVANHADDLTADSAGRESPAAPVHTVEQVHAAIARARAAQREWAAVSPKQRAAKVRRIVRYIERFADSIATTISTDTGKPRVDAMAAEVLPAAVAVDYYCRMIPRWEKPRTVPRSSLLFVNKKSRLFRVPFGVVGIIAPWNYPLAIPIHEIVPALVAGNAVIFKGAPETASVSREIERMVAAADLPSGLFSAVYVESELSGDALLDGGVDKLFFTGSVRVGKLLMGKAAAKLAPVSLELGGSDAMLVCADANVDRAAAGAMWAGFSNAGQSCGGVERIYVHAAVHDAFIAKLKAGIAQLRVGRDSNFDVDIGPLCTARQAQSVRQKVADSVAMGAQIAAQSKLPDALPEPHNFVPATLLTNVNHQMPVMREEVFGPVLSVMKVERMEQAVALANDSELGLTASVWSKDARAAEELARQIRAGTVTINDHLMSHGMPETPWGGFKHSGVGRCHGVWGFEEMTQPQVIIHDRLGRLPNFLHWHPYDETGYRGLHGAISMLFGKGLRKRLGGLLRVSRLLPRVFRKTKSHDGQP